MNIVFTTLYEEHAVTYCARRPNQNLIIERDLFSGKFNVICLS